MSLTREAELALLVADQEKDDSYRVWQRELSLDKQLTDDSDAGNLHDLLGTDLFGEDVGITRSEGQGKEGPSDKDLAYWKYLRFKCKWKLRRISEHVGVPQSTISRHLKRRYRRDSENMDALEARFDVAKAAYERGARLIDIAAEYYEECGYASPESCYQQLRIVFVARGVPRFRRGRYKHGMLSRDATEKQRKEYWKEHWRNVSERHRATLTKCKATTRAGNRCKRWSISDSEYCVNHGGNRRPAKWTKDAICAALVEANYPQSPHEWTKATDDSPAFTTVYNVLGSWPKALAAAQEWAAGA